MSNLLYQGVAYTCKRWDNRGTYSLGSLKTKQLTNQIVILHLIRPEIEMLLCQLYYLRHSCYYNYIIKKICNFLRHQQRIHRFNSRYIHSKSSCKYSSDISEVLKSPFTVNGALTSRVGGVWRSFQLTILDSNVAY